MSFEDDLEAKDLIEKVFPILREKERSVIYFRWMLGMTRSQIARIVDVCEETVRQIEAKSIRKLKKKIKEIEHDDNRQRVLSVHQCIR